MPGSLCISIDLELGWGIWDRPDPDYFARCVEREQRIVRGLLQLFERHEITATWAIVGRLLDLDEARARDSGAQLWFAPKLVDAVRNARVTQEIGSHSYSHRYYDTSTPAEVRLDLAAARRVHERLGVPFNSFVFPRNQVGHVPLLREAGLKVYRSVDHGWHVDARRLGRSAGRLAHLATQVLPLAPAVVQPVDHDGIIELPSSMLFMGRKGVRKYLSPRIVTSRAARGMRSAIVEGGCFHLWFHPSNFYHRTDEQLATLDNVLAEAARQRNRGKLAILPMQAYAK